MVVIDPAGHPMKYDGLTVLESVVATQHCRIEVDVPGPGGHGWRSTNRTLDISELDDTVRENIQKGSAHILEESYVSAGDAHYDARTWPVIHPYGSGSVYAEPGAGNIQRHARNRLTLIQSWFRRSPLWGFWALNRHLYNTLFNLNRIKRQAGIRTASSATDPDRFTRSFGTAAPSSIPESTEWWKRQQKDLFAITDDAECGIMHAMVTISHNDNCAELLATVRRGVGARPTEEEYIEYLLSRKKRAQERPPTEKFALEHVLSYQRRVTATKNAFMRRGATTPLGVTRDWWDRTEAQMRGSLHAHILCWFEPRREVAGYIPIGPIKRRLAGTEQRQRPLSQQVEPLAKYQEDHLYHAVKIGRIVTEMVRPSVKGIVDRRRYGGWDYERLRIAGLARCIQTKMALHSCTTKYCLKNRTTCRFFFPWPSHRHCCYHKLQATRICVSLSRKSVVFASLGLNSPSSSMMRTRSASLGCAGFSKMTIVGHRRIRCCTSFVREIRKIHSPINRMRTSIPITCTVDLTE